MKLISYTATKNPCYQAGRTITPKGVMIHSIGVPQPAPKVIADNFNQASADSCVHAVIGTGEEVYQLLPWNHRAWHCGSGVNGSANSTHISFEMSEPVTIRYTLGASWVDENPAATKAHVQGTYRRAVELTAYLCKEYGLLPEQDGVLLSHSEGHQRGIASNHADVEHLWSKLGLTMTQFRKDVAAAMKDSTGEGGGNLPEIPSGEAPMRYTVQAGAFAERKNAEALAEKMKQAGFEAYVKEVQVVE